MVDLSYFVGISDLNFDLGIRRASLRAVDCTFFHEFYEFFRGPANF